MSIWPTHLSVALLLGCTTLCSVGCNGLPRTKWFGGAKQPVAEKISDGDESPSTETKVVEDESRYRLASYRTDRDPDDLTKLASDTAKALESEMADDARNQPVVERAFQGLSENVLVSGTLLPFDASLPPQNFRMIGESEMLELAFQHSPILRPLGLRILDNPAAAATVYDTAITASDPFFGPQAALAEFDSQVAASLTAQNNDRVFNNITLGGQVQELTQDFVTADASWRRRSQTGAVWDMRALTGYDDNNRAGNSFANYWEKQFEVGVRQPLMRGAGREYNTIAGPNARPGFNFSNGIVIARLNTQVSNAEFEIAVRSFVRDLYATYWELSQQYMVYEKVTAARELSYATWQSVLAKADAKLEGGEAHREAQSRGKYHRYQRDVAVALGGEFGGGGLYGVERRLRKMIGLPATDGQLLRPSDSPVEAKLTFDYDAMIARSMSSRTELKRQSMRLQQQRLRLVAAKNFLLPQMDLIGRYRLRGFGDDLTGGSGRFSNAYRDFFSFDHQEWEFGLEVGNTVGQRQARAAVRNAGLQLQREQAILLEQQRIVQFEISDAYGEVSSSYLAMQASADQVDAATERMKGSKALFEADKIQTEFVLDAQEELLQAQRQFANDQNRYAVAIVNLIHAAGSLLSDVGVHLSHDNCQSHVIYAGTEHSAEPVPAFSPEGA